MAEDPHRTVHAQAAFEFTEVFAYKFTPLIYGTKTPRRLKLLEPDGPSTAGGALARQSIVLVPDDGKGHNLVVGFIDVFAKTADVRGYVTVSSQYEARFKKRIDISKDEYEKLVADLTGFLKIQKIEFKMIQQAVTAPPTQAPSSPPAQTAAVAGPADSTAVSIAMLFIGVLIGFALGYVVFELL